jgi:hypothetical protein
MPTVIIIADPDQERQTILDWLSPRDFELTQAKLSQNGKMGVGIGFFNLSNSKLGAMGRRTFCGVQEFVSSFHIIVL